MADARLTGIEAARREVADSTTEVARLRAMLAAKDAELQACQVRRA